MNVVTCGEIQFSALEDVLSPYGIDVLPVPDGQPITGTHFGEPEAGLIAHRLYVRSDTPVHSALHEACSPPVCAATAWRACAPTWTRGGTAFAWDRRRHGSNMTRKTRSRGSYSTTCSIRNIKSLGAACRSSALLFGTTAADVIDEITSCRRPRCLRSASSHA